MKKLYTIFFTLIILQITGCASLVTTGIGNGGYQSSPQDRAITAKVEKQLVSDRRVNTSRISVNTYKGTVTLNGYVTSSSSEQRVVALARSVQGVTRVISRLTITAK